MRILFDHAVFAVQRFGGISRYHFELATQLAQIPEIEVTVFSGLHINGYLKQGLRDCREYGVAKPDVPRTARPALWLGDVCLPLVSAVVAPHIYHATGFDYRIRNRGYSGARVLTLHDMTCQRCPNWFPRWKEDLAAKRALASKADGIICISEATRRDVVELLRIPPERTRVVYHGNSLRKPSGHTSRAVEPDYLLFVGNRSGYKEFATLLKAWSRTGALWRNLDLVCFGGGAFNEEELTAVSQTPRPGGVRQISGRDEVLVSLYAHAKAFVFPSVYEGFGMPLLEAMSCECPVIAARASCFPEIMRDAGLYFEPGNADDLSGAILAMLNDGRVRESLRKKGLERAANFTWPRCARETAAYYTELVSRG